MDYTRRARKVLATGSRAVINAVRNVPSVASRLGKTLRALIPGQTRQRRARQSRRSPTHRPSNSGRPPVPLSGNKINALRFTVKNVYPRPAANNKNRGPNAMRALNNKNRRLPNRFSTNNRRSTMPMLGNI